MHLILYKNLREKSLSWILSNVKKICSNCYFSGSLQAEINILRFQ